MRIIVKITKLVVIAVCLALLYTEAVLSYSDTDSFAPANIGGSHIVQNNESLKDGRFTFVLTAIDNSPMPENSVSGIKKVTIGPNKDFSFGEIHFSQPGTYRYTVSRDIKKSDRLKQDNSVYECSVTTFNDGNTVIVFKKKGKTGKPNKIVYTDTYIKPKKTTETGTIKTGDNLKTLVYGSLFIGSILLLIRSNRKKADRDW